MRKVMVVAAIGLCGAWGGAQTAEVGSDDGFDELFGYYEENPSIGDDERYGMMVDAWGCEQDALILRIGANYKARGVSYQAALEQENYRGKNKELNESLLEMGYEYESSLDPSISKYFVVCMIEQHKKYFNK